MYIIDLYIQRNTLSLEHQEHDYFVILKWLGIGIGEIIKILQRNDEILHKIGLQNAKTIVMVSPSIGLA